MIKSLPGKSGTMLRLGRRRWSYADLREMPESMDRLEIVNGDLYMSPSGHVWRHQSVASRLSRWMGNLVEKHGLGEVFIAPSDVVLGEDKVVQPDIFFVAKERLHTVGAYVSGAPDLIVEVVSPSSAIYDRKTKYALYEETGVREYWLVDPEDQSVEVYVLRSGRFELRGRRVSGEQVASELLSGFEVKVDAIFS